MGYANPANSDTIATARARAELVAVKPNPRGRNTLGVGFDHQHVPPEFGA